MIIFAIDPGTTESAYCLYDNQELSYRRARWYDIKKNEDLCALMRRKDVHYDYTIIEMIQSYGSAVGHSVFETCVWIGRFIEASDSKFITKWEYIYRKEVVKRICGNSQANDSAVRSALLDMYGGRTRALGTVKKPGPLHGCVKDMWSALAVAIAWNEKYEDAYRGIFD